jgi:hypothetical protein
LQSVVPSRLSLLILALFCASTWIFVHSLKYVEFGVAGRVFLGGAVRRLLGAHIHLRNLESSLAAAATPNDCWLAIRNACSHLGFHHVRIQLLGETYDAQFGAGGRSCWSLHIPVSDSDYVTCAREVGCTLETTGIACFADLLGSALRGKLLRPSCSIDPQIAALVGRVQAAAAEAATA